MRFVLAELPILTLALWGLATVLTLFLLGRIVVFQQYRSHPLFTLYLTVNLLQTAVGVILYQGYGFTSSQAYPIAWTTQGLVVVARALVVGEVCYQILAKFTGIWAMAVRILSLCAFGALILALYFGRRGYQLGIFALEIALAAIIGSALLLAIGYCALAVVALLFWALRGSFQAPALKAGLKVLENAPQHLFNMAQIRQGMDPEDLKYVASKGGARLAATLRRERRRVALMYLSAIRLDFERALHIARVLAVFSPEVSGHQEYQRLKLSALFRCRFQLVRLRLLLGDVALPQVAKLGLMVTSLTGELEAAIAALGERSVLAVELAIQSDR